MNVKKMKSGHYKVRISIGKDASGKYRYKAFTAPTRREAELMAAIFQMTQKDNRKSPTIQYAIDSYIETRTEVLSPSTIRGYRTLQRDYFQDCSNLLVMDLTNEDIQDLVNKISKGRSPKTVKNAMGLLMSALRQVNPDKRFYYSLPQPRAPRYEIPENEDISKLMEASRNNRNLHLAIILSAIGSLRRGEVCALRYEDILRDFNAIWVHGDVVQDENRQWIYKDYAKNPESTRQVPYPKEVIDLIGEGTGLIIDTTPNCITSSFIYLRDKLGLKCRFHDLRHYTASIMHAIGIPDKYIMQRTGHKSPEILEKIYKNPLKNQSNVFSKKANKYFSETFSEELKKGLS